MKMKTREVPAICSHTGCKGAAVQARLAPLGAWVSRCAKHDGQSISVNLNNVVDHKKGVTWYRTPGGKKRA